MIRVTAPHVAEALVVGAARLPRGLRWVLDYADLFTADPVFAGLHSIEFTSDGRCYADTAHVIYPTKNDGSRPTIAVPEQHLSVAEAVHELGHVLDWVIGFRFGVPVVTEYAKTNGREAFAEWLCAWTCEEYRKQRVLAERDEWSRELWRVFAEARWDSWVFG